MRQPCTVRRLRCAVLALAAVCALAPAAAAEIVFDFEELPPTSVANGGSGALGSLVSEREGLTLTVIRSAGGVFDLGFVAAPQHPIEFGTRALDPFWLEEIDDWFVGTFSQPVTSVALDATDFAEDQDQLELYAYAGPIGTGDFVASALVFWSAADSSPDFTTASVAAVSEEVPIVSIRFRGGSPTAYPNSMFIDNIRVLPVPEPGAGALGVAAAMALATRPARRRRG
jgi:hypothetical protein